MKNYLLITEVSQKQAYIFRSKKLKNNIIASDIIRYVTDPQFYETVAGELYDTKENLVYSGGGHSVLGFDTKEKAREFVKQALDITQKAKGIRIPQEFYDMPIHMYSGKGVVLEIPNPLYECECNYVALLCGDSKKMYTNEYYASSKTFGLCCITESMRMSLKAETDNFEKFVKATIGV